MPREERKPLRGALRRSWNAVACSAMTPALSDEGRSDAVGTPRREPAEHDCERHGSGRLRAGLSDDQDRLLLALAVRDVQWDIYRERGPIQDDSDAVARFQRIVSEVAALDEARLDIVRDKGGGNYMFRIDGVWVDRLVRQEAASTRARDIDRRRMGRLRANLSAARARTYLRRREQHNGLATTVEPRATHRRAAHGTKTTARKGRRGGSGCSRSPGGGKDGGSSGSGDGSGSSGSRRLTGITPSGSSSLTPRGCSDEL